MESHLFPQAMSQAAVLARTVGECCENQYSARWGVSNSIPYYLWWGYGLAKEKQAAGGTKECKV